MEGAEGDEASAMYICGDKELSDVLRGKGLVNEGLEPCKHCWEVCPREEVGVLLHESQCPRVGIHKLPEPA